MIRRRDRGSRRHHQQPTPQDPRLEDTSRSPRPTPTLSSTSRYCDHRLNPLRPPRSDWAADSRSTASWESRPGTRLESSSSLPKACDAPITSTDTSSHEPITTHGRRAANRPNWKRVCDILFRLSRSTCCRRCSRRGFIVTRLLSSRIGLPVGWGLTIRLRRPTYLWPIRPTLGFSTLEWW